MTASRSESFRCGPTHHMACACREAQWLSRFAEMEQKLAAAERRAEEAEANLATATWTPSDDRVMELLVAEQELASERAAREAWEREVNAANAERIRLHNEAEDLSERLGQFEAAGFPDVASVLDRVETERAAREKAEFRLRETEGWHRAAVRERDLMREQMDEILGYEDIETPGPDENVASVVLAAMEHLREAREKAERAAQTWRELCDHRASDLDKQEALLARAEAALREIEAKIGHFADMDVPDFPLALIPLAARIARAYFAEAGR